MNIKKQRKRTLLKQQKNKSGIFNITRFRVFIDGIQQVNNEDLFEFIEYLNSKYINISSHNDILPDNNYFFDIGIKRGDHGDEILLNNDLKMFFELKGITNYSVSII